MDKQKILILGGKGNLGQALKQVFSEEDVLCLGKEELDITDISSVVKVLKEFKPDFVFNCAAFTNVDKAEIEEEKATEVNGKAVGKLAKVCYNDDIILVHFSTGMVFGNDKESYNEDDKPNPINAYGRSKLFGEVVIQQNLLKYYIIRTCWLYGEEVGGKKSFTDLMLSITNKDMDVIGDEFGNPTYVKDLARMCWVLINLRKPFGIYHLVNEGVASRYDWAKEIFSIQKIVKHLTKVNSLFFKRDARRAKYEVLNNTKFVKARP